MKNTAKFLRTITLFLLLSLLILTQTNIHLENSNSNHKTMPLGVLAENGGMIINASDYTGTNDTQRLQAALDDVPPEGATVIVQGTWTAAGLNAKSRTTIQGINATIQRPDNTTAPFITFTNQTNFAILNLTFNGKEITDALGIEILNCKSFIIQQCTFVNIKQNALRINTTPDQTAENFTVNDNMFENCHVAPILVFGVPGKRVIFNFIIQGNTINHGTNNGKIGIAFATNGTIYNNTITNSEYGIATRCVSKITIKANTIINASSYGIYFGTQIGDVGTDNVTLEDNKITGCNIGIARYYGTYPVVDTSIKNNTITNSNIYDIVADFSSAYINNTITTTEKLVILDTATSFKGTRTINNTLFMPGDINSDLKIDMKDIGPTARMFGISEDDIGWDPRFDIIKDSFIDFKDIAYISRSFGAYERA